jgi:Mn-containing catalase
MFPGYGILHPGYGFWSFYEPLINLCADFGSKDALQFLVTREITDMKAFTA